MHAQIHPKFVGNKQATDIAAAISSCVHCGFCNATCPTYQRTHSENDGPRGRIYLIKQMIEQGEGSRATQVHLDRCLTCQSCVTTCPSGVRYDTIIASGRHMLERLNMRSKLGKLVRMGLFVVLRSRLFAFGMVMARFANRCLPKALKLLPEAYFHHTTAPATKTKLPSILLLAGCVQDAIVPSINQATVRLAAALGYTTHTIEKRCCGALAEHLGLHDAAHSDDTQTAHSLLEHAHTADVISMNASGCSVSLRQLPERLAEQLSPSDARVLSHKIADFSVWVAQQDCSGLSLDTSTLPKTIAYHPPCTLQHGLKAPNTVQTIFAQLEIELLVPVDSHLCCGSAGTYAMLEPRMASALRRDKLRHLHNLTPDIILSANIGCIQHLQQKTTTPVVHWVEFLASLLK